MLAGGFGVIFEEFSGLSYVRDPDPGVDILRSILGSRLPFYRGPQAPSFIL